MLDVLVPQAVPDGAGILARRPPLSTRELAERSERSGLDRHRVAKWRHPRGKRLKTEFHWHPSSGHGREAPTGPERPIPEGELVLYRASYGRRNSSTRERTVKSLESLRAHLAHAQDITAQDWPVIADIAIEIDRVPRAFH